MNNQKDSGNLIITRRVNEMFHIGDDVEVTIKGIQGGQVRIAVMAPKDVRVDREEVRNKINAGIPQRGGENRGNY